MPKPLSRAYSHYSTAALLAFSQLIRRARIERRLTTQELADRAGISRGLLQRIEKGDPGCAIGIVFEVAAILGLRLFDADQATLAASVSANKAILTLLPKSIRLSSMQVKDDF